MSALMLGAWNGHMETVKALVELGARVDLAAVVRGGGGGAGFIVCRRRCRRALAARCCTGQTDGVALRGSARLQRRSRCAAACWLQCEREGPGVCACVLLVRALAREGGSRGLQSGVTPLMGAALEGHMTVIAQLVAGGADVNASSHVSGREAAGVEGHGWRAGRTLRVDAGGVSPED